MMVLSLLFFVATCSGDKQLGKAGMTGEFFRYIHIMGDEMPSPENQDKALKLADEIRCQVCEKLLKAMLPKESISEDTMHDILDGNEDYPLTGDAPTDHVLKHKKGCQKHFKDHFIALGYQVQPCDANSTKACIVEGDIPNETARETYEVWKEGVFLSCEQTIGVYGDEIVEFLDASPSKKRDACFKAAKCDKGKSRSSCDKNSCAENASPDEEMRNKDKPPNGSVSQKKKIK